MNDVMVDIETLGTRPNSVILSIAAVEFERCSFQIGRTLCLNVDMTGQTTRAICTETLKWWLTTNSNELKQLTTDAVPLLYALETLHLFLKDQKVWSQGIDFDFNILDNAYQSFDKNPPWKYNAKRDTRTLYDAAGLDTKSIKRAGTHHNAKDDCIHQIHCVVESFKMLGRGDVVAQAPKTDAGKVV